MGDVDEVTARVFAALEQTNGATAPDAPAAPCSATAASRSRRPTRSRPCAPPAWWSARPSSCCGAGGAPGVTTGRARRDRRRTTSGPRCAAVLPGLRPPALPGDDLRLGQRRGRARHPGRPGRRRTATSSRSTAARSSTAGTATPRSRSRSARSPAEALRADAGHRGGDVARHRRRRARRSRRRHLPRGRVLRPRRQRLRDRRGLHRARHRLGHAPAAERAQRRPARPGRAPRRGAGARRRADGRRGGARTHVPRRRLDGRAPTTARWRRTSSTRSRSPRAAPGCSPPSTAARPGSPSSASPSAAPEPGGPMTGWCWSRARCWARRSGPRWPASSGRRGRDGVGRRSRRAGRVAPDVVRGLPRRSWRPGEPVTLVPHSNAGLYVAALAAGRPVEGVVFVDAGLPSSGPTTPTAPPGFRAFLAGLAGDDGLLPPWTRWWPDEDVDALFPDDAGPGPPSSAEQRRLPLGLLRRRRAVAARLGAAARGVPRLRGHLRRGARRGPGRGWPVETLPGEHLHQLVDPAGRGHAHRARRAAPGGVRRRSGDRATD